MEIIIPANRSVFPVRLLVSLLIAIGIFVFFLYTHTFTLDPYSKITILAFVLFADIRIMILLAKAYFKIRFDHNAHFMITDLGITDNLTLLALGEISWEDIDDIAMDRYQKRDILLIGIRDPEKYMSRQKPMYSRMLRGYIKKWNTPLVLSGRLVEYDLESLRDLILTHSPFKINSYDLRD
jgi:hypothetical protein